MSMVSQQMYLALFRALLSKLVTSFSSREIQFFEINNSEFSFSYLFDKSLESITQTIELIINI